MGLDPKRCTLFVQSEVKEHAELHLLLSMVVPLPWLERVPTYKELMRELRDKDLHTYGFLGYPVLQAADILIYDAEVVPVGEDQEPHIELTREIARRFNAIFGRVLKEPAVPAHPLPPPPRDRRPEDVQKLRERDRHRRGRRSDPLPPADDDDGPGAQAAQGPRRPGEVPGVRPAPHLLRRGHPGLGRRGLPHRRDRLHPVQGRARRSPGARDRPHRGAPRREFEQRPDDVRDVLAAGRRQAAEAAGATMERVRSAVRLPAG